MASSNCESLATAKIASHGENYVVAEIAEVENSKGYGCCLEVGQRNTVYFDEESAKASTYRQYMNVSAIYLAGRPIGFKYRVMHYCLENLNKGVALWHIEPPH